MATYEAQCSAVGSFAYSNYFKLYVILTDKNGNATTNKSSVDYNVYCQSSGAGSISARHLKYFKLNGVEIINEVVTVDVSSPNAYIPIASGTLEVEHSNVDGTGDIDFEATIEGVTYGVSASINGTFELTPIARFSEINSVSVQSTGVNSAVIQYSVSRVSNIFCSVNDGGWGDARVSNSKSGTFTVTGLQANKKHSFRILVRAVDSELDRISDYFYGTTKDSAKISSLPNFEHGSNPVIGISSASGSNSLNLVMKVGNTQILSRTVKNGNNTITFSDTELDNLYKKYGSSSTLTATFVLSGNGYTDTKTCTVTLKGNQKTIKSNISGTWKRGKLWVNVAGTWKRGVIWENISGNWKRSI